VVVASLLPTFSWAAPSEVAESTRIVINTSGTPVFKHAYQSDPPRITFEFLQETVYGRFQESIAIQKGIVEQIDATYFEDNPVPGAKRPIKTLSFSLSADTTYAVYEGPRSINLVIHHPEGASTFAKGKVSLSAFSKGTFESQIQREALQDAFLEAQSKIETSLQETMVLGEASTQSVTAPVIAKPIGSRSPQAKATLTSPVSQQSTASIGTVTTFSNPPNRWWEFSFEKNAHYFYIALLFFVLGGLIWPPSWFSIQQRMLRREQRQSWEMAKRIISLKEEAVAREEQFTKALNVHKETAQSLQEQMAQSKEAELKLQADIKALLDEKESLKRDLESSTEDLHELARERIEISDRLQVIQGELTERNHHQEDLLKDLQEISARYDEEIARRRELETAFQALRDEKKGGRPKSPGEEKRRWTRLPISPTEKQNFPLRVEVQGQEGRLVYGYPRNVSLGGLSFELKDETELPNPLSMTLFFPEHKSGVQAQGKVVWKVQKGNSSRYGVSFVDLSQNGSDLIGHFMKERFPQMREAAQTIEQTLREKHTGKTVTFKLDAPSARMVSVVGDFNSWDPEMHPMKKMKDGQWKAALLLPPGTYEYQFYVDGIWQVDPNIPQRNPNAFGGENSILQV